MFLRKGPRKVRDFTFLPLNGPIHVVSKILKFVVASAAEAEIGAEFIAAQESILILQCLEKLGHKQPLTLVHLSTNAVVFMKKNDQTKRFKVIDMRVYWLQDRCEQGKFQIYWVLGKQNLGVYHTKHRPPSHYKKMRATILHSA